MEAVVHHSLFPVHCFSQGAAASLAKQQHGTSAGAISAPPAAGAAPTESISPFSNTTTNNATSTTANSTNNPNHPSSDLNSGNVSVVSANADGSTLDGTDMPIPGMLYKFVRVVLFSGGSFYSRDSCRSPFQCLSASFFSLTKFGIIFVHFFLIIFLHHLSIEVGTVFQSYYGGIPAARGTDEIYFMGIIDILQVNFDAF